ncbi:hypothetical protein D3C76_1270770 [compost metagenome]
MHTLHRQVMDFGLRNGDFLEDRESQGGGFFTEAGPDDHLHNFLVMAVMLGRAGLIREHVQLKGGDAAFGHAGPTECERVHGQLGQLLLHVILVRARIHQSGQRHVAGNSRKTIQIYDFHKGDFAFFSRFCWITPAA